MINGFFFDHLKSPFFCKFHLFTFLQNWLSYKKYVCTLYTLMLNFLLWKMVLCIIQVSSTSCNHVVFDLTRWYDDVMSLILLLENTTYLYSMKYTHNNISSSSKVQSTYFVDIFKFTFFFSKNIIWCYFVVLIW